MVNIVKAGGVFFAFVMLFSGCGSDSDTVPAPTVVSDFAGVYSGEFSGDTFTGTWETVATEDGLVAGTAVDNDGNCIWLVGSAQDNGDFNVGSGQGTSGVRFGGTFSLGGEVAGEWTSSWDSGTLRGTKDGGLEQGGIYVVDILGDWAVTDAHRDCMEQGSSEINLTLDNESDSFCDFAYTIVRMVSSNCDVSWPGSSVSDTGSPRYVTKTGLSSMLDVIYGESLGIQPSDITIADSGVTASNDTGLTIWMNTVLPE